jgi:hypothetical protein
MAGDLPLVQRDPQFLLDHSDALSERADICAKESGEITKRLARLSAQSDELIEYCRELIDKIPTNRP